MDPQVVEQKFNADCFNSQQLVAIEIDIHYARNKYGLNKSEVFTLRIPDLGVYIDVTWYLQSAEGDHIETILFPLPYGTFIGDCNIDTYTWSLSCKNCNDPGIYQSAPLSLTTPKVVGCSVAVHMADQTAEYYQNSGFLITADSQLYPSFSLITNDTFICPLYDGLCLYLAFYGNCDVLLC